MSFIYINDSFVLIDDRRILVRLMSRDEHFQVVYCDTKKELILNSLVNSIWRFTVSEFC